MKNPLFALAFAALALAPLPALAAPLKVVASFSVIGDFAAEVGGDRIDLTTLVGPNGDIHVYEPKPADAVSMSKADVILVNGLALEGFLDRLVAASDTKAPVVELTKGITPIAGTEEDADHDDEAGSQNEHDEAGHHHHGAYDPHAWQSAANAEIYVKNIEAAFCTADPDGCPVYTANAEAYLGKLTALDGEIHAMFDAVPAGNRVVITSHDAFGYFGREYGLSFLAPQGISTDAEPSAAGVAALIQQIRSEHAAALFTENVTDPRVVEQISRETGISIGGELYALLSGPDGPAATYLGMERYNAKTIATAILGK